MEKEIWKDIKGYEGLYQVSNLGRIKSFNYWNQGKIRILKLRFHKEGYLIVSLNKNTKTKIKFVHRLIAEAFIPNPENKPEIDHINGIRDDNRIENLRWVTRKENMNNELTKQRCKKSNVKKVRCLTTNEVLFSISEASRKYDVDLGDIVRCCKGQKKTAKGYRFEYYKE